MKFNFNSSTYSLKPRIVPLLGFILALSILLSLSGWQIKRLNWKTDLISKRISSFELPPSKFSQIETPELNEFRKIIIEGELLNEKEMYMLSRLLPSS